MGTHMESPLEIQGGIYMCISSGNCVGMCVQGEKRGGG